MTAPAERRIRLGIDTGGTFTDVVAVDEDTGRLVTTKTPSTPADPARGFLAGLAKVLAELGLGADSVAAVHHGTTVATNKLLEGDLGNLGFVTTEGFEFLLEIARQSVPDGYGNSYFWVKPDRIVPADRVRTVGGRMAYDGTELRPFDQAGAATVARWFRDRGIDTIGICFLHSYANDAHEVAMREVLARENPGAVVSISSEVLREYREYERAMTTLVDAAVKPAVTAYVTRISGRLRDPSAAADTRTVEAAPTGRFPFYVMKSNGGVLSAPEVAKQPVSTLLSGPAAGAVGAAVVAGRAGFDRVLTCDGGGTSTDVAVVVDGRPALTTEGTVGGYPCKIPMIDVVTVGAGGGSIASISPEGTLKVGPRSAGADPGPICYGTGGTEPTVTDAHLLLGRIPAHLLGGEVPLDDELPEKGFARLAGTLGLSVEECAAGVLELSAWNQANALRQVTVSRGLDAREFTMVAFGGSGPLLACRLMDVLGLPRVLVPRDPGNLSAYGLLTVDVRNDYVQTAVARQAEVDPRLVQSGYDALAGRADAALEQEGFPSGQRRFVRTADLRYFGQAYEVRVDVPEGPVDDAMLETVAGLFHDAHRALYGYDFRGDNRQDVEWVNLRVAGVGPIRRPGPHEVAPGNGADGARTGSRPVFFDEWVDSPVLDRALLGAGDVVEGPAVVQEYGSTLPVHPGFAAAVDRFGNLVIERRAS
jgi:N-methylhydantoinase A